MKARINDPRNKFHYCMSKFLQVRILNLQYDGMLNNQQCYPCAIHIINVIQIFIFRTKLYKFWIFNGGHFKNSYFSWFCGSYHRTSWNVLTFCTIVYTAGHQYTKWHANVHMYTKVITILSFQWRPFWKFFNGGYHKNQVICPDILYDLLHSWPSMHTMSCKYSHADQSYINFEFSVVAILIFFNGGYYKIRWYVHTLGKIRYTVDHQYKNVYANIHMV